MLNVISLKSSGLLKCSQYPTILIIYFIDVIFIYSCNCRNRKNMAILIDLILPILSHGDQSVNYQKYPPNQ